MGNGDLLFQATHSEILADYVGANLAATWFTVPHGHGVSAPQTGTRPGDPCADLLFGFIMIQILQQINVRAREAEIPLQQHVEEGELTNCITWVDDVALAITAPASQLVQHPGTWHEDVIWARENGSCFGFQRSWCKGV